MAVSGIFQEALEYGIEGLTDSWLSVVAHDAVQILLYYTTTRLDSDERRGEEPIFQKVSSALKVNVEVLQRLESLVALARPLVCVYDDFSWTTH